LRTLANIDFEKLDVITLIEVSISLSFYRRVMHENFILPLVGLDETIAFDAAKPFDDASLSIHRKSSVEFTT
jgi:hypothetical protein